MLAFRPLTAPDLLLVHAWIQRPHVAEWWHAPTSLAELKQDYLPAIANESSTRAYIARTAMVRAFVERIFRDPAVTKVQTDPSPGNERAIRCYRRAGFVDQGEITTPDGPALLMVRHRLSSGK